MSIERPICMMKCTYRVQCTTSSTFLVGCQTCETYGSPPKAPIPSTSKYRPNSYLLWMFSRYSRPQMHSETRKQSGSYSRCPRTVHPYSQITMEALALSTNGHVTRVLVVASHSTRFPTFLSPETPLRTPTSNAYHPSHSTYCASLCR